MRAIRAAAGLLISLSTLLMSCASSEPSVVIPARTEVTRERLTGMISDGKLEGALQEIMLERGSSSSAIESDDLERIYQDALDRMEEAFRTSLESREYERSLQYLVSLRSLGQEERYEGYSEGAIYLLLANREREQGNAVTAFVWFLKALKVEAGSREEMIDYGSYAIGLEDNTVLRRIVEEMHSRDLEVPANFSEFAEKIPSTANMMKGVVTIWVNRGIRIEQGVGYPDRVIGSGFFIDRRGYLITNYHVISSEVDPEYEGYSRLFIRLSGQNAERIPAKVVGYDRTFDIALLKVESDVPYAFSFTDTEQLDPGERVFAIGSPGGLENTITSGIVSATGRRFLQMGDAFQVDVPINPGNSGGPLVNERGELAGFVFAGIEQFEGINFAIPSHWGQDLLPDLYGGSEAVHPWVGMALHESVRGLEVMYVVPGEAAHSAGIAAGDRLVSIGGHEVRTIREAQKVLLSLPSGSLTRIDWTREREDRSALLALRDRPFSPVEYALQRDRRSSLFAPLFGMSVEELSSGLWSREYTVTRIFQGGSADETGLSVQDPLSVIGWTVNLEHRVVLLRIQVKKRKAGFLESAIQLGAYLETDNFI